MQRVRQCIKLVIRDHTRAQLNAADRLLIDHNAAHLPYVPPALFV